MKDIISIIFKGFLNRHKESILLFDSTGGANEIAQILNGSWDGCNSVSLIECDEIAVNTAANLLEVTWCYQGASQAVLERVTSEEIFRRYAVGERNFVNANLRCAVFVSAELTEINLSYAKLGWADLSQTNLEKADLTAADISQANLSGAELSGANLTRANLKGANLKQALLCGANLSGANLAEADLTNADLTGADLSLAELRGANLHLCNLNGANLTGAKFIESQLDFTKQ
jgi:uncharacterized protein YjbI with pentapeptide repeats